MIKEVKKKVKEVKIVKGVIVCDVLPVALFSSSSSNEERSRRHKMTEGKSDLCQWGPSYMHQFTFGPC